jgi:hypothetical protein
MPGSMGGVVGTDLQGNVGWTAWNISKRISERRWYVRAGREALRQLDSSGADAQTRARLSAVLDELEEAARRGMVTWDRIMTTIDRSDPALVDPPVGGIRVVHNRRPSRVLHEVVLQIWADDNAGGPVPDDLFGQFQALAGLPGDWWSHSGPKA